MRDDIQRGALYALAATACFSLAGAAIKAVSATVSNELIVFSRNLVSFGVLLPWLLHASSGGIRTRRLGGHLWRAAFGVAAMYCFFYAIAKLPLAEAMLLTYSTPLYVPFIAWVWIHERPDPIVFPAAVVGLVGIGFIVKPTGGVLDLYAAAMGVLAGVLAACAMVSIRRITDTEPATRIVFYFAALSTAISAVPLSWAWRPLTPTEVLLLIFTGITATAGQIFLTQAYGAAPAARVGPFTYSVVVFSGLLAWLLWGETLDWAFAFGTLLVVATCVMVGWRRPEPHLEE